MGFSRACEASGRREASVEHESRVGRPHGLRCASGVFDKDVVGHAVSLRTVGFDHNAGLAIYFVAGQGQCGSSTGRHLAARCASADK